MKIIKGNKIMNEQRNTIYFKELYRYLTSVFNFM